MSAISNQSQIENNGIATEESIPLPPEGTVVFYNDDFTTMQFVVDILITVFLKSKEEAEALMQNVHNNGSSIIGKYTYDIAVSRTRLTIDIARKNGFPLRVEV